MISIKRETKNEVKYSRKNGALIVPVTKIKKCIFGIPYKTLYEYRETYYGKIKETKNCKLNA
jgi:hypothetical protein